MKASAGHCVGAVAPTYGAARCRPATFVVPANAGTQRHWGRPESHWAVAYAGATRLEGAA